MDKSFNIIIDKVELTLKQEGFEKETVDIKDHITVFKSAQKAYSINFNPQKNIIDLKVHNVSNSEISKTSKVISSWLFEPGVSTKNDSETIAADFVDTLTSSSKSVNKSVNKKNKDSKKNIDSNFFLNRLISFFPDLKQYVKDEKENYQNFRYVTFIQKQVVPLVNNLINNDNQKDKIKKFANLLNNMYEFGNIDVKSFITVIILRNINNDKKDIIEEFLDPSLIKTWKAADKLKGKNIKPEIQKKKVKNNFMSNTLKK